MVQKRKLIFFIKINVFIFLTWISHIDDNKGIIDKHFYKTINVYRILSTKYFGFFRKFKEGDSNIVSVKEDISTINGGNTIYKSNNIKETDETNLQLNESLLNSEGACELYEKSIPSVHIEKDSCFKNNVLGKMSFKNEDKSVMNPNNENIKKKTYIKYVFLFVLPMLLPLAELIMHLYETLSWSDYYGSSTDALLIMSIVNIGVMSTLTFIVIIFIIFICISLKKGKNESI
ncbi:hypothetical protein MKS88_001557 [Plasmodium brasilianum]|uniref:Uncharacterized protein n=1 Tax=Plasmodium brasilianum TaxID=5824 RepID=A0ACB9YD03_PLABR|nr:hypothetical protein MKS88_001557 [Plasmodium brasilianum]